MSCALVPCLNLDAKRNGKTCWLDFVYFPLTPTLSLGERENRSPPLLKTYDCICSTASGRMQRDSSDSFSPREKAGMRGNVIANNP
jgi:hypothetical protein